MLKLIAPCLFGLEAPLAFELKQLGMQNIVNETGRVLFEGTPDDLAKANLNLRCAERVLILLSSFSAKSFEDLFQGVKAIHWQEWLGKNHAFPVKGHSLSSQLHSVPDCQAIIKKAVVEKMKTIYKQEWFSETGPMVQIQFSILKDRVSIMLDTSGEGLHKRGYRAASVEAPIKETLAAGILDLARIKPDKTFMDPLCGSGTFLIEAAMKNLRIAPGLNRKFAAEAWQILPPDIWERARTEARSKITNDPIEVIGYDHDPDAVALALHNAKEAGVSAHVRVMVQDIKKFKPVGERGVAACNPPYGERLLDIDQAREIYKSLGAVFPKTPGWSYFIISPDETFELNFGRRADKKRKLYNGMLKCDLYQYFK